MYTRKQMLKALIQEALSCCLGCGRFSKSSSSFCGDCETALTVFCVHGPESIFLEGKTVQINSLFHWIEDESRPISKLVMSIKGGQSLFPTQYWAEKMAIQWALGKTVSQAEQWVVVAPPRHQRAKLDHGYWLAKGVSRALGLPMFDALENKASSRQKEVNKSQRMQAHVVCHEKISQDMSVLFVDDVMTTGATAIQSYKALQRPSHFEILTLARRDLAGATTE
jgi:predicted amidophosphoribosyltransferase